MGSRNDEEPALDAKHGVPELPLIEAGLCGSIIITRARRSYARLRWLGLARYRSLGLITLGFARARTWNRD